MPSKHFPLPPEYADTFKLHDKKCMSEIYYILRAILKDPMRNLYYSISSDNYKDDELTYNIYPNKEQAERRIRVTLPYAGSTHEAALLVQMGSHTIEETWDEYKDFWYEDLEKQVSHLEKGNGP